MSPRILLPLHAEDISVFAKSLRSQLTGCGRVPGHVELLNMLARSAGFANFQHFRAVTEASAAPQAFAPGGQPAVNVPGQGAKPATTGESQPDSPEAMEAVAPSEHASRSEGREANRDRMLVNKLTRYFDQRGRLIRWPSKFSHTGPCLWVLWGAIPAGTEFDERAMTRLLDGLHLFGDPALLRRELFDRGMLHRTTDCRCYRRIEKAPPALALELMRRLRTDKAA